MRWTPSPLIAAPIALSSSGSTIKAHRNISSAAGLLDTPPTDLWKWISPADSDSYGHGSWNKRSKWLSLVLCGCHLKANQFQDGCYYTFHASLISEPYLACDPVFGSQNSHDTNNHRAVMLSQIWVWHIFIFQCGGSSRWITLKWYISSLFNLFFDILICFIYFHIRF